MIDEQLLALTRESAARIARLSLRQIDYWAATDLVVPSIDRKLSAQRRVRLYGFLDVMSLAVAGELKQRGVTLQHIRQIVGRLQNRYERPLTELRYATVGKHVYFQHTDGTWEGDLHPDQIVLHEVLNLNPIRARIAEDVERGTQQAGHIERRRGARGNRPVLAGTRIPVDAVRRYIAAGRSVQDVLEAYPDLTPADVETVRREMVA